MDPEQTHSITQLLQRSQSGDVAARDQLLEAVYRELHTMARRYAARERKGHSLQATALLNEVYLKMFGVDGPQPESRSHFFAMAARNMRNVLVDYARNRSADKRGGQVVKFSLEDADGAREFDSDQLLEVHRVLEQLEEVDARLARLVEYKYFAGMKDEEIAEALGISFAQVRRDWAFARSWLRQRLVGQP